MRLGRQPLRPTLIALGVALALGPRVTGATDPVALARSGQYGALAAMGTAALPPLLTAYPVADRKTRSAILLALGSLNIKSAAAKAVLDIDVAGDNSHFQDLHRYALAVVDPAVRSVRLFEQVSAEGVPLDPELGRSLHATLSIAYGDCNERVAKARRYVADLADPDPTVRYAGIVSLRILTGGTHAYHPWAPDRARTEPLRAWRRWLRRLERSCRA